MTTAIPTHATDAAAPPLLDVRGLRVGLPGGRMRSGQTVPVLRGLDFTLGRGQTLGVIGESGCGKSITALALMGLLPEGAQATGSVRLEGRELLGLPERQWCTLRGQRLAMVFQEPMSALNPLQSIGRQIAEGLRLHRGWEGAAARAEALRLLERVQLPQARQRLDAYPHQLSGGQRQRVVIAIALACGPDVLIADEPTTALDASTRAEVLDLIASLVREDGMALLLISHDLSLVARAVQRVAVMYAGLWLESGPTAAVLRAPAQPYTQGLLAARPRLGQPRGQRLPVIPGRVPDAAQPPPGCPFAPRCARATALCHAALPGETALAGAHMVRCLYPGGAENVAQDRVEERVEKRTEKKAEGAVEGTEP